MLSQLLSKFVSGCSSRLGPSDAPLRYAEAQPSLRSVHVPGNSTLFILFFAVTATCSCSNYFNPILGPQSASYIDQENAALLISVQTALLFSGALAVPFISDHVERSRNALPTVQVLATLNVATLLLLMGMLKTKSLIMLLFASAGGAFAGQASAQGLIVVFIASFSSAAPQRAASIGALAYSTLYLIAPLYCYPPVLAPIVYDEEGTTKTDNSSLQILLMFVLISWIMVLSLSQDLYRLSIGKAGADSTKVGLRVTVASVARGLRDCLFHPEYRGLLLASNSLGICQGLANSCITLLVYYAEDFTSMTGEEAFFYYGGEGPLFFLVSGLVMIPMGMLMDRYGIMPAVYMSSIGSGCSYVAMAYFAPTPTLFKLMFAIGPMFLAIFTGSLISYVVANVLPNEHTSGRDMGMIGLLGLPASGSLTVGVSTLLESFGSTPSQVNLAGRVQYTMRGYRTIFFCSGILLSLTSVLVHISGTCLRPRAKARATQML